MKKENGQSQLQQLHHRVLPQIAIRYTVCKNDGLSRGVLEALLGALGVLGGPLGPQATPRDASGRSGYIPRVLQHNVNWIQNSWILDFGSGFWDSGVWSMDFWILDSAC